MVRPTNLSAARELLDSESSTGVVSGDDIDWPTSPTGSSEPSPRDQWKQPVRAATTANITISSALNSGDTLDGVTLADGDRVLVKDQTNAYDNGIYVVGTTPARAVDFDESDEILGAIVYVYDGTMNTGTTWITDLTVAPSIGIDDIPFIGFAIATTNAELNIEGGQSVIKAHGATGSTETIDPTDGNVHTLTLDANCTVTLNAPSGSGACSLELWVTEDGTGGWGITWPGSATEQGSHTTTAGTTQRVILETIDGGTSWIATWIGSSSASFATPAIVLGSSAAAGAASTVIRSDATIAAFDATVPVTQAFGDAAATGSAAYAARRDHVHGMPSSAGGASEHAHVVSETHLSDGSTTTYTLDQNYEAGSVIAWNTTTIARLTVTEVLPDQATVSAAGSSGDKIVFDYAATLA